MTTIPGATKTIGHGTLTADQVYERMKNQGGKRLPDVRLFVDEIARLCLKLGYNQDVPFGQFDLETDSCRSEHWQARLNPGGIGVTDSYDNLIGFSSGTEAAQAMLVHFMAYALGHDNRLASYLSKDERFILVHHAGYAGICDDLGDFGNGVWASDPRYAIKVAGRIDAMLAVEPAEPVIPQPGPEPGELTFGRVPKPAWQDRQIPNANNIAWDNLGARLLRGVVYHRQVGTNWGTDGWFRTMWYQGSGGWQKGGGQMGLTDFGIDHTTGETLQWNAYDGAGRSGISPNRSGWASGPWQNPPGDGQAYVATYGVSGINRDLVSLEIAGMYESPISEAGILQIVAMSAWLADQAKVPFTNYPINPHTGLTFVYWHNEFQNNKPCPGAVVIAATPGIIARTKTLLKRYQQGAVDATQSSIDTRGGTGGAGDGASTEGDGGQDESGAASA